MQRRLPLLALCALCALAVILTSLAQPTAQAETPTPTPPPNPTTERLMPSGRAALSVEEALDVTYGNPGVIGFVMLWDDIYLEYHQTPGDSRAEALELLLAEFDEKARGIRPLVAWLLGDSTAGIPKHEAAFPDSSVLPPSRHAFSETAQRREKRTPRFASAAYRGVQPWAPNDITAEGKTVGSTWKVTTESYWDVGQSPTIIPRGWGFEMTVWLTNDGLRGVRDGLPSCAGGDPDNDFPGAFRGDTSSVPITDRPKLVSFQSLGPMTDLAPYVDWWSASDKCWHKNYDYGIGYPQNMKPHLDLGFGIRTEITTRLGTQPAGVVEVSQQVVQDNCAPLARPSTGCMNLDQFATYPGPGSDLNGTLGTQRLFTFPGSVQIRASQTSSSPTIRYTNLLPRGTRFGDSTGDGLGDLLYVRGDTGAVHAYKGRTTTLTGAGTRSSPFPRDHAVKALTKIPDLNGDSYDDYLWVNAGPAGNDALHVHMGGPQVTTFKPHRNFGEAMPDSDREYRIGTGWAGMRHLSGGIGSSGAPDVYAISPDGTLKRYALGPTSNPTNGAFVLTFAGTSQVGRGWGSVRSLTRLDWDHDGDWDILAIGADGNLRLYLVQNSSVTLSRTIGGGWNSYLIVNAGDFNGDGSNDIAARHMDGTMWAYPVRNASMLSRRMLGRGFSGSSAEFVV